jgi:hypothetical protein
VRAAEPLPASGSSAAPPDAPTVLVTAVGAAEGSRAAAAALACAGAAPDLATLLVDVGGRTPRPTLLASDAARRLEERLVSHLPTARVAARGQVCHLAVPAEEGGFELAAAAVTVARGALAAIHLQPATVRALLDDGAGPRPTGVLLRADVAADRPLLALAVRELLDRGLAVAVLKRRLGWVAERRAHFGALPPEQAGGLPQPIFRRLTSHTCYVDEDDARTDAARAAQSERGDHAGIGPR